jgi:hypothetical protein
MARPKIYPGHGWHVSEEKARQLPGHFTPATLARSLGVSRAAVSKWVTRGGLPAYWQEGGEYSGCYIILHSDFLEWALRTGRYEGPTFWRPLFY